MTTKVSAIERKISEVLQDSDQITWTSPQVWDWVYDAEQTVVLVRPDANPATDKIALVAGTRQSITSLSGALRLLDVVRNTTVANAPGRAVRRVGRGVLDSYDPDWHVAPDKLDPSEFVFDDRNPKEFYVNPPSDGLGYMEVMFAKSPIEYDKGDLNQLINVDDSYVPALIEWSLYRAFSRDSMQTANWQRAQAHRQSFFDIMGIKSNSDIATSLKQGAQLD